MEGFAGTAGGYGGKFFQSLTLIAFNMTKIAHLGLLKDESLIFFREYNRI